MKILTLDFFYVLLFYCTFSQWTIFLCGHLVELIVSLLEKLGYKFHMIKRIYKKGILVIFFPVSAFIFLTKLENQWCHLLLALLLGMVFVIVQQFMDYSTVDVNSSQRDDVSPGAFWAEQAYEFFYKNVLENLNDRILMFEQKHNVTFTVKKLMIVVPFSCDVSGALDSRDNQFIEYVGDLAVNECDQAANVNRKYKNTVYKIHVPSKDPKFDQYIVAEFASPLATLWRTKTYFKKEVWIYHRNCFIKTLKHLTRNSPCIIVDFDDEKISESLSSVLMSTVEKYKIPQILIDKINLANS